MEVKTDDGQVFAKTYEPRGNYDKMQLQRDFMNCWMEALNDPVETRVIIDLDIEDERQRWTDDEGKEHTSNKYYMIDGSDGERQNENGTWLWSSSWGQDTDAYIKPEEVLPRALSVINGGRVLQIYNDGY